MGVNGAASVDKQHFIPRQQRLRILRPGSEIAFPASQEGTRNARLVHAWTPTPIGQEMPVPAMPQ